jgi:hypothetical protein
MNFSVFIFKNSKRATIPVALFFAVSVGWAAGETYKDLIEKAYNLSLQKDRVQAMNILTGALKREGKKSSAQKELSAALEQVSKVFYSDKAQQLYELGLSLKNTDPGTAAAKLQEASRLEPDNISIEIALGRQSVAMGDCDGAGARVNKHRELFQAVEELRLLAAQVSLCQGRLDDYANLRIPQDLKNSSLNLFWLSAEAEYLQKNANPSKSQEATQNMTKISAVFPETFYWKWKTELDLKLKAEKSAQRYLSLCKTMTSRLQREFLAEPLLCRRTTEVETFLKKTNNSEV